MAPSFTLKGLSVSPSRPSLPLSIPSTNVSPLPSPGRSPTSYFPQASPSGSTPALLTKAQSSHHHVNRDEAFKVVRYLEDVLSAWNEYRLALAQAGKAGKKLAGAMKDLAGCMDKTDVPAQTIKPAAAMVDTSAELLGKLSKKVDGAYDQANTDASKYFNLLAKESRSHDAYLTAVTKKHDKAEKAYRKASKSIGDTATAHSGLHALKTSLADDIARANADQSNLLGSKQAGVVIKMASSIGGLAVNITSFFSEGLRKVAVSQPDVEYFRALADIHWTGSLPSDLDEADEEKKRDEIRLIKTRVALGEMDIVGEKAWNGLLKGSAPTNGSIPEEKAGAAPPTPVTAPTRSEPHPASLQKAPTVREKGFERPEMPPAVVDEEASWKAESETTSTTVPDAATSPTTGPEARAAPAQPSKVPLPTTRRATPPPPRAEPPMTERVSEDVPRSAVPPTPPSRSYRTAAPSQTTMTTSSSSGTLVSSSRDSGIVSRQMSQYIPDMHMQPRRDPSMASTDSSSNNVNVRSLPQSPDIPLHHPARPPVGPRNVSMPGGPIQHSYLGHAPRRSVSQIARDMERNAVNERQSAFEAHQSHRSFAAGCSLCSMDYDRMVKMRQQASARRVTMPPAYTQPQPPSHRRDSDEHREHREHREHQYHDDPRDLDAERWEREQTQSRRRSYYAPGRQVLQAPQPRRPTGHSPDFALEERSF